MLFARWQHHLWFRSGLPYVPLKAMVTKISKWSRIQDSFRITPKIESLLVFAIPDMPSKFQKDPSRTFWVILLTHRQTDRQTNKQTKYGKNIISLAKVIKTLILKVWGFSESLMLIRLKNSSLVLVVIGGMPMVICSRFHEWLTNNGKIATLTRVSSLML